MKLKKIEELNGDEVLARDIVTMNYQIILHAGVTMRREYIKKLSEFDIEEVYIRDDDIKSNGIVILKSEIQQSVKEAVKNILERHIYQNNDELEKLSKTADNIISTIIEEEQVVEKVYDIKERSADIYDHSISSCSLAILTALKLGVENEKIHDIGVGCLLHDIGLRYMNIDYNDQDVKTLNRQKLAEYKKHPVYGYSSLKDEEWISELSKNIILYHHERRDGSGFPLHVKEIPFECEIVNVCDTFDEMIGGIACARVKVYEAVEYLKNGRDILFDSKVINAFLSFTAVYPVGSHVMTNEGELAVVVSQNREFQDRPVIRILKDKDGNDVKGEVSKNLIKIHNIFIERAID